MNILNNLSDTHLFFFFLTIVLLFPPLIVRFKPPAKRHESQRGSLLPSPCLEFRRITSLLVRAKNSNTGIKIGARRRNKTLTRVNEQLAANFDPILLSDG